MLIVPKTLFRYAAWSILALVLVLIVTTFLDYGITWDEELQSQYGQAVVDYYLSGFKDQRYAEIFNLYIYGGMFDGLASAIDRFAQPFYVYDTRHLLNALFGLAGLWGVWRLGRVLGGGAVGVVALILCATTPVYYGHMFNNPKDIPFAAGIVWTLYYMTRSYAAPSKAVLLKLGVILGLTLGVRIGGVMIFAFWLAAMGIVAVAPLLVFQQPSFPRKREAIAARLCGKSLAAALVETLAESYTRYRSRWIPAFAGMTVLRCVLLNIWRHAWREVLPVAVIAYSVMLICWPWAQQHPVLNPLRALGEFSNFPQDVEVLLDGTNYRSTQLPWYYVPLYFGIQTPELLLFLWATALVFMPKIWRHFTLAQKQGFSTLLLMAAFPVIYAMLRRPALYDTVRHFLFVIPLGCVVAALAARAGFAWCLSQFVQHWSRRVVAGMLGVVFALFIGAQILTMTLLHPYEYIFANHFAGGVAGAYGRYESDYWGTSFKEAAAQIQALVAKEGGVPPGKIYRIAICGPWAAAMIYLPPDYEPVVANEPAEFFLSTTRWMCQDMRPGKEVIRVERLGVPLSIVKDLRGGYEYYQGNEK